MSARSEFDACSFENLMQVAVKLECGEGIDVKECNVKYSRACLFLLFHIVMDLWL